MTLLKLVSLSLAALAFSACAGLTDGLANGKFREGEPPNYRGYEGYLPPLGGPVQLEVRLSDELASLSDGPGARGGVRGLRNGFSTGGYLGERDLLELLEDTREEMTDELAKRGVGVTENSDTILRLTLSDARPGRPTFSQLSREPSLSARSVARGGASLEGELVSASTDEVVGEFTYGYYEDFLQQGASGIWTDARRAIDRGARRAAKEMTPLSDEVLVP